MFASDLAVLGALSVVFFVGDDPILLAFGGAYAAVGVVGLLEGH